MGFVCMFEFFEWVIEGRVVRNGRNKWDVWKCERSKGVMKIVIRGRSERVKGVSEINGI